MRNATSRWTWGATGWALLWAATAAVAAPDGPVKIGVLGDFTGAYADLSGKGSVEAARMAVEDFGGKVLGKPVEIVFADHQSKTDVGATVAKRWYDAEGVDMITDLTHTAVAIAVQGISKDRKKINIVTSTASTALTNENCSPWSAHWTFDAYALSNGTARAMIEGGAKKWFFITADYGFGHNLEAQATSVVKAMGGTVVGRALHPLNTSDFSSQLVQARASGADVIALANAGTDTSNVVKQANEFGLTKKQKIAALLVFLTDVHAMGLKNAQGLVFTEAFYWDMNDETRAWSERFYKRHKAMPTMVHAGTYSAVMHYLKAIQAVGSKDSDKVMARMRETPVNDFAWKGGQVRIDGRHDHDMYLFEVKAPGESKRDWDYYKTVRKIPQGKAFMPLEESKCAHVKKG